MANDNEDLIEINLKINAAENAGDVEFLARVLAPALAFMRADGKTVDDANRFLQKMPGRQSPRREELNVEAIEVMGNRAIVKCIVTQAGKRYHNIRLFVRLNGEWKLLGWANEPS